MSFLLRAGAVIALIYFLSPLSDGPAVPVPAQVEARVQRNAEALAAAAIEQCRRDPARCLAPPAPEGAQQRAR